MGASYLQNRNRLKVMNIRMLNSRISANPARLSERDIPINIVNKDLDKR